MKYLLIRLICFFVFYAVVHGVAFMIIICLITFVFLEEFIVVMFDHLYIFAQYLYTCLVVMMSA